MEDLDLLYKAFDEYRRDTRDDTGLVRLRRAISHAASGIDRMESVRSVCVIDEDWIEAIEKGLPFVEEAIREERQFIRQEGSVTPIEQARRVSKASVEHLARHGNLISHAPEDGESIVPDKLLVVEKLSDYAVYENRFLYMLLCYLRDFVSLRAARIAAIATTWTGHMILNREAEVGKRKIRFALTYDEAVRDDRFTQLAEETAAQIRRIHDLETSITALLCTPLMQEVAKAPMIKPPITRTNALRMDNALRMALWLYDYISAYTKPGYAAVEQKHTVRPFPPEMADELSELVTLTSFLTYEYGNGLNEILAQRHEAAVRAQVEADAAAHEARIRRMKQALAADEISADEYMLMLEDRGPYMDVLTTRLSEAREEIAARQEKLNEADRRVAHARAEAESYRLVGEERLADMEALQEQIYGEVVLFESRRVKEKLDIEAAVNEQVELRTAERLAMNQAFDRKLEEERQQAESERQRLIEAYEARLAAMDQKIKTLQDEKAALEADRGRIRTDLLALRARHGMTTDIDDYSSKERYEELVEELQALDALIGREWKMARKRLRHEYLWSELTRKDPGTEGEHGTV